MSEARLEATAHESGRGGAAGLSTQVRLSSVWFPVVGIAVAAAVARWWGLGTKSLWFDEAYSVYVAGKPLAAIPGLLQTYDTHPPLHYLLLHVWMDLFGRTEVAVRSLSVLAGVAGVLLTLILGSRLAGRAGGILAAAFVAASPFHVAASQEARMYPLLTALGAVSFWLLWRALEGGSRRHWAGYAVVTALALYTHYFAALLVLAQGVYVLSFERRAGNHRRWLKWLALAAVMYVPNLPLLAAQVPTARAWPDIRPPFGLTALTDLLGMLSFGGGLFGMGTYFKRGLLPLEYRLPLLLPFLLLSVAGAVGLADRKKRAYVLSYLLIPLATVALVSLRWNIFYERYFSLIMPPYAILLASGIIMVTQGLPGPRRIAAITGLAAVLAAYQGAGLTALLRSPPAYDWRAAAAFVTAEAGPDDFILYIPAFARIPFEYYYRGSQQRASLNPREVFLARGDVRFRADVDAPRMVGVARDHPRMWIVATVPIGYEARKEIGEVLAPYFVEVEGRGFGLVYTFLWQSRIWKNTSPP